jgi:hypothetical protein
MAEMIKTTLNDIETSSTNKSILKSIKAKIPTYTSVVGM